MWRLGGFISVDTHMDCGSAMSLFRNPCDYAEEKMFIVDLWIPFFAMRFELRKDWSAKTPIKGGEWYWDHGPGKMIEARRNQ